MSFFLRKKAVKGDKKVRKLVSDRRSPLIVSLGDKEKKS